MTTNRTRAWRMATTGAIMAGALAASALPAAAHGTCSDLEFLDIAVHGHHVVRDYVVGGSLDWPPAGGVGDAIAGEGAAMPGGPGTGHRGAGVAPGASFCNSQSQSPGFHVG